MSQTEKNALRKKLQLTRQLMSQTEIEQKSNHIIKKCQKLIQWETIKILHTFVPSLIQNEIDTWPLLKFIWQHYPVIQTAVPHIFGNEFQSIIVTSKTTWQTGLFGIPEPNNGQAAESNVKFDVVIVPMLGFDKRGHRLGYGKGMYDRFLATQANTMTIGICYDSGFIDSLPIESHDVSLKYIVTDKRVLNFTS